ncbi:MAG: efflux RND transporter periplasmic adaptor subunit [Pseudobdellovibrionaceae bacterium]
MTYRILGLSLLLIGTLTLTHVPLMAEEAHGKHGEHEEHTEHDEHEENSSEIADDMAAVSGIKTEIAASAKIASVVSLTGRITMDNNKRADIRARFAGPVREVHVELGQLVQKGEILARIESNDSLETYAVTSPMDGVVLERNTSIGDVAGEQPLFVIADLTSVWAKFHVFPKDAANVTQESLVRIHTLDNTQNADAHISLLLPVADSLTQTHIAIAPLDNSEGLWRPGMTVEGDVVTSENTVPLAVRKTALQTLEDQTVVFVKDGTRYDARTVETGISDADFVAITEGLEKGEEYVSAGSFIVKADVLKSGAAHEH